MFFNVQHSGRWRAYWAGAGESRSARPATGLADAAGFHRDPDSTVMDREGQQEGARKGDNPRRQGRNSPHPRLAVLAEAPVVLHGWLRSGHCSSARGTGELPKEAWALAPATLKGRGGRADRGFFADDCRAFLASRALP